MLIRLRHRGRQVLRLQGVPEPAVTASRIWQPESRLGRINLLPAVRLVRTVPPWRLAMRCLFVIGALLVLARGAVAADPVPTTRDTIDRGLAFLAEDGLAWKEARKCASCHHIPFTIWALSEGKKQGYAVDETALAELTAWVVAKD